MKSTKHIVILALLSWVGCGDAPANPSDVAAAGTFLAISSSAIDDIADSVDNNESGNNGTFGNNGSGNNGTFGNNGTSDNPYPFDLDCGAALQLSGAIDGLLNNNGCAGAASGATNFSVSWLFRQLGESLTFLDLAPLADGDRATFETDVIYQIPGETVDQGWLGRCEVTLTQNDAYTDANGQSRAIWFGNTTCDAALVAHGRSSNVVGGEWEEIPDGEELVIESFNFSTPYPFAR